MHFGGAYGTAAGHHSSNDSNNRQQQKQQEYRGPPMLEAMIKARDEMSKGYNGAAVTILKAVLEQDEKLYHPSLSSLESSSSSFSASGNGGPKTSGRNQPPPLSAKQIERIYMLLSDCRYNNKNHEQALLDAEEAIKASKSRTPQPYFIKGRVLMAMLRVPESLEAFEMAEILMASPPPVVTDVPASPKHLVPRLSTSGDNNSKSKNSSSSNEYLSPEELARRDGWAQVGIDPSKAPSGSDALAVDGGDGTGTGESGGGSAAGGSSGPKEVHATYEWIHDLEAWRKSYTEAKALGSMLQTHTIPRNVLTIGALVLRKKVDEVSRRSIVLLVQNDTATDIRLAFNHFFDGTFLANHNFPNTVKPGEVGIAAVHNNSWKGTVKGVVGFSFGVPNSEDGVLCCFENPLVSNFKSDVRCCSLKNMDFNKPGSSGRVQWAARSAVSTKICGNIQFKAIADASPGAIQKFTLTTVKRAQLKPIDLVGIFEFLPSIQAKKCTIVNRLFRNLLNSFPPQSFTDLSCPRKAYPDYCCAMDLDQNPFTIPDKEVTWRIQRDLSGPYDRDEFACFDNNNNRVFTLITDLGNRSLTVNLHYNYRKCVSLQLLESWLPLSKTAELKVGGRNVGKFETKDSVLKCMMDAYTTGGNYLAEVSTETSAGGGLPAGYYSTGGSSNSLQRGGGGGGRKTSLVNSSMTSMNGGGSTRSLGSTGVSGASTTTCTGHGVYYSVRHNGTGSHKPSQCSIRIEDGGPEVAAVYLLPESGSRRSQPILELTMHKGADALLCVMLAFYSRARFAGSFSS